METKKLSLHRALSELKMLNDRIETATENVVLVRANRKSNEKIDGMSIDDFKKDMQGSYDKVISLIQYRNRLKSLVVASNAQTIVKIGSVTMTVAEAIERKQSIRFEKELVDVLRGQYQRAISQATRANEALPEKLETYLINILGSKEKQSPDEVKLHTETFMKRNEYELIDPMNIKKVLEALTTQIEEFESEVDAVLSESNATTFIEL